MIIRKIKPEEIKRTEELFCIAFEFPYSNEKTASEVYEDIMANQDTRANFYWQERWAAFEDDDKTMMSYFVAKPYPINFDGHTCIMTGIGGVSTLPQYRRAGTIRKCFEAALPDMYQNGVTFSYLYPFSTAYYRKFGYELCCEKVRYQLKLDFIPCFDVSGKCYLVDSSTDSLDNAVKDIKKVYAAWQNKYNMMVVNEAFEYAWIQKCNPAKDQVFTYVYKDCLNEPKAYITFSKVDEPSGRNLRCHRLVYADIEGFKGLMNLVHSLCSDHLYITFELPQDQFILPLLPEWSLGAGTKSISLCGMVRVIHVQNVLEHAAYRGSGRLTMQITDKQIPENNKTFLLEFTDGKAVNVSVTNEEADISMGINDFSRLITGVCSTEEIAFLDGVTVSSNMECIQKVFYKKPVFLTEYF